MHGGVPSSGGDGPGTLSSRKSLCFSVRHQVAALVNHLRAAGKQDQSRRGTCPLRSRSSLNHFKGLLNFRVLQDKVLLPSARWKSSEHRVWSHQDSGTFFSDVLLFPGNEVSVPILSAGLSACTKAHRTAIQREYTYFTSNSLGVACQDFSMLSINVKCIIA